MVLVFSNSDGFMLFLLKPHFSFNGDFLKTQWMRRKSLVLVVQTPRVRSQLRDLGLLTLWT